MSGHPSRPLPHIVSQHAEEAAFQWLLRAQAVHAPHYSLVDLARLDGMVEAHLDGLRVAGDAGWEICRRELAWEEAGEVFAAASLAYGAADSARAAAVQEAILAAPDAAAGLVSALGWLPWERAEPHARALLAAEEPILRRAGLAAFAVHRQDPGAWLDEALRNAEPVVIPRALRAAGELGRRDALPRCRELAGADDPETTWWAAWAASLLGDPADAERLAAIAAAGGPRAEAAARVAARCLAPARAVAWQRELAAAPERRRLAAVAAGATGDPQLVPWLLEQAAVDELARPAGEAFALITGADLAYLDLDRDAPDGFEAGPTEDPDDPDVALDPDEDLPWADPARLAAWWDEHRRDFRGGGRFLLGAAVEETSLRRALAAGTQRQRAAAALELVRRQPGRPLFEVRAPGHDQRRDLAAGKERS